MTLTTHIVIAAAAAKPLVSINPLLAFIAAVASHYLSDAIPHWDYSLSAAPSKEEETKLWARNPSLLFHDLWRVGLDLMVGTAIGALAFTPRSLEDAIPLTIAITGGILPDILQGVYFTGKASFLKPLHTFHDRIHSKIGLGPYPLLGLPLQLLIVLPLLFLLF